MVHSPQMEGAASTARQALDGLREVRRAIERMGRYPYVTDSEHAELAAWDAMAESAIDQVLPLASGMLECDQRLARTAGSLATKDSR